MSTEKDKEALAGSEEEKTALKVADTSADGSLPGMDDSAFDHDNSRARFINHDKGDGIPPEVYVDVEGKTKLEPDFVGLTKEELLKFADDPKWKKIRLAFLVIFWVGWFAMLAAAVIIIVLAPKCPPRPKLDWWQTSNIYQICPKSFKDSDANGLGDLNGVHEKLDYLTGQHDSINISALVLSSIYPHGGTADGFDVTDFVGIDPDFGTMEDFDSLRVAMHKKGLKLILDFIPNHSSREHQWFEKSKNREGKYADYYIWKTGPVGSSAAPTDWDVVGGSESAWTRDPVRGEYYLHQFGADKPDLNLRNPDVREELQNVLQFWLEKGVDGFRVDAAQYLFECANFTNDEACRMFQPESYEIVTDWRDQLDTFGKKQDKVKYLMVESEGTVNQTVKFHQHNGVPGANAPINRQLLDIADGCRAKCIFDKIESWVAVSTNAQLWNNWQIGNMDTSRVSSRFNMDHEKANLINMMALTLPGTAITYYGEEIGMHDLTDSEASGVEKYRSPMQWTPDYMAGFTDGNSSSLVVPDDVTNINVKTQMAHGAGISNLEVYASLSQLRAEPSMQWGKFDVGIAGDILFYVRQATGFPGFLVAMNFGPDQTTVNFVDSAPSGVVVPDAAKVVANTGHFASSDGEFDVGAEVGLSNLVLQNNQGVVFQWEEDPNE